MQPVSRSERKGCFLIRKTVSSKLDSVFAFTRKTIINNLRKSEVKLFYVVATTCSALITGCVASTSPSELRNDVTPIEYNSAKNARVIALCISDEWERINNPLMKVQLREKTNGYSVWVEQTLQGSPLIGYASMKDSATFIADIDNTKAGSNIRYYSIFTYKKDWVSALDKCLDDTSVKAISTPENLPQEPHANGSASQKLRELQSLKKDGLITEEEFQNKKRQLLDKL